MGDVDQGELSCKKKFVDKANEIFTLEKQKELDHPTLMQLSEETGWSESPLDKQLSVLAGDVVKWLDLIWNDDSDLDGAPDWRDELHGTNDQVEKFYLADGSIVAEVNNGVWAQFRSDGTQIDGFLSRTLSGMTSGDTSLSATIGSSGPSGSFTYSGPDASYTFSQIPPPVEIIVESSY